tara:strand:+ start:1065 stop:1517 length:453 start_codon:yes stop_codon:yes gene_type:complete
MSRPIRDLVRALAFSAEKLPGATADAVEFVINDARDRAEMNLTGKVLNRRSGALLRTLRVDVSARNNKVSAQLQAGGRGVNYARIHEMGGTIEGKPWLVFQLPDGGWRKVRRVTIPRRPYLEPAIEAAMGDLGPQLREHLSPLLSFKALP